MPDLAWPGAASLKKHLLTLDTAGVGNACYQAGVDEEMCWRLRRGHAVPASPFMAFCAVTGIDPTSGVPAEPSSPGPIVWDVFGIGIGVARYLAGLTIREAGRRAGVGTTTISVAERGRPVSAHSYIRLCQFYELSPHSFCLTDMPGMSICADNQKCTTSVARETEVPVPNFGSA